MIDPHDCWTCMNLGEDHDRHADVKGGTQYEGWKPPCENWKQKQKKEEEEK